MNEFIFDIQDRLGAGLGAITERLPAILADPRAYPREAMLLAAIVGLVVLLAILFVVVLVDTAKVTARRRRLGVKRTGRWVARIAFLGGLGLLILLVMLLPNTVLVSQRCTTCHAISEPVATWENDVHASVACYSCHARPGLAGSVQASVREAGRFLSAEDERTTAHVYDSRCLDCHEHIAEGVVGESVRMQHSDIIGVGYECADCHFEVGHAGLASAQGEDLSDRRSVMTVCMGCHDGDAVSAECELCHDGRPSDSSAAVPAGDTLAAVQCDGCHRADTTANCIDCHGLVLPHPANFMRRHAGLSWDDPALCARCHETASAQEGCACHAEPNLHGTYEEWFPRHGPQALQVWPGGCNCHDARFCAVCHETSPF